MNEIKMYDSSIEKKRKLTSSLSIFCEAEMKEKILKYMKKTFKKLTQYDNSYLEEMKKIEQEEEKLKAELNMQQITVLNNIMEYHRSCVDNARILAYLSGIIDGKKSLKKICVKLKDILFI